MKPIIHLWDVFSMVGIQSEWKKRLKDEYELWSDYLISKYDVASSYPCNNPKLNCQRTVLGPVNPEEPDTPFYDIVCRRLINPDSSEPQPIGCCESLSLPESELMLFCFDSKRFLVALSQWLSISFSPINPVSTVTYHIGNALNKYGDNIPVFISLTTKIANVNIISEAISLRDMSHGSFYWLFPFAQSFTINRIMQLSSEIPETVMVPLDKILRYTNTSTSVQLSAETFDDKYKTLNPNVLLVQSLQELLSIKDLAEMNLFSETNDTTDDTVETAGDGTELDSTRCTVDEDPTLKTILLYWTQIVEKKAVLFLQTYHKINGESGSAKFQQNTDQMKLLNLLIELPKNDDKTFYTIEQLLLLLYDYNVKKELMFTKSLEENMIQRDKMIRRLQSTVNAIRNKFEIAKINLKILSKITFRNPKILSCPVKLNVSEIREKELLKIERPTNAYLYEEKIKMKESYPKHTLQYKNYILLDEED